MPTKSKITLALAAVVLFAPMFAGSSVSAAASARTTLHSGLLKLTSSTGVPLNVQVDASVGYDPHLVVTVSDHLPNGVGETHDFRFPIQTADLVYDGSSGTGRLQAGSEISPYGTVNLTLSRSSASTQGCSNSDGSTTTVDGMLAGIFAFDTRTKAWGALGSTSEPLTFPSPDSITIVKGAGCYDTAGSFYNPCESFKQWIGPQAPGAAPYPGMSGKSSAAGSFIWVHRGVALSSPKGARRSDYLEARAPRPTLSRGVMSITTSGSRITGRAKLSGGTKITSGSSCLHNGNVLDQSGARWFGAVWSSPQSNPLRFHFQAAPPYTAPLSGTKAERYAFSYRLPRYR